MTTDELQRLMEALDDLRDFCEGNDPATFAQDRDPRVVREAIAAWDAVNALSEVFLSKLKAAHGIPAHLRGAPAHGGRPPFVGDLLAYADI